MAEIPGISTLKEILTGTGKRQKELIDEYKSLAKDSPEEAKKILEAILRIIKHEQFLRNFVSITIILLVVVYALAIRFEKYIFTEGEVITKERAIEFLSQPENQSNYALQCDKDQIGIVRNGKLIGHLSNVQTNNFITLEADDSIQSRWIAKNNCSEDLFEGLMLTREKGIVRPINSYPGYEKGEKYQFESLDNFWFQISDVAPVTVAGDTLYRYNVRFGEGPKEKILWMDDVQKYTSTPNGLGNISDAPPRTIEKAGWKNTYIVYFGIGRYLDNRVYKINGNAYALSISEDV